MKRIRWSHLVVVLLAMFCVAGRGGPGYSDDGCNDDGGCNGCDCGGEEEKPGGYLPPPPPPAPKPDLGPRWRVIKMVIVENGWWVKRYVAQSDSADLEATIRCNGWDWPLKKDPVLQKGQKLKICGWRR